MLCREMQQIIRVELSLSKQLYKWILRSGKRRSRNDWNYRERNSQWPIPNTSKLENKWPGDSAHQLLIFWSIQLPKQTHYLLVFVFVFVFLQQISTLQYMEGINHLCGEFGKMGNSHSMKKMVWGRSSWEWSINLSMSRYIVTTTHTVF